MVTSLLESHRQFLAFLEKRVGNKAIAEDILQAAFSKAVEKADTLRDAESSVAWFYRLLRNALIDHYRRTRAETTALAQAPGEPDYQSGYDTELEGVVCGCLRNLVDNLKPEYGTLLKRVDLEGWSVPSAAGALGITPNNAGVRLHRARLALRKQLERVCGSCTEHACLDCTCGHKPV